MNRINTAKQERLVLVIQIGKRVKLIYVIEFEA